MFLRPFRSFIDLDQPVPPLLVPILVRRALRKCSRSFNQRFSFRILPRCLPFRFLLLSFDARTCNFMFSTSAFTVYFRSLFISLGDSFFRFPTHPFLVVLLTFDLPTLSRSCLHSLPLFPMLPAREIRCSHMFSFTRSTLPYEPYTFFYHNSFPPLSAVFSFDRLTILLPCPLQLVAAGIFSCVNIPNIPCRCHHSVVFFPKTGQIVLGLASPPYESFFFHQCRTAPPPFIVHVYGISPFPRCCYRPPPSSTKHLISTPINTVV